MHSVHYSRTLYRLTAPYRPPPAPPPRLSVCETCVNSFPLSQSTVVYTSQCPGVKVPGLAQPPCLDELAISFVPRMHISYMLTHG